MPFHCQRSAYARRRHTRPHGLGVQTLEFLAFALGEDAYGSDIQTVQELCGYGAVTRIAKAPEHINGMVNLRGVIVPILNIASRVMGMVMDSVPDVKRSRRNRSGQHPKWALCWTPTT